MTVEDIADPREGYRPGRDDNEELVRSMLGCLAPDYRACIVLRSIEGLDYKEISEVLKVNVNTVKSRLKRAREKLASVYGKGGKETCCAAE